MPAPKTSVTLDPRILAEIDRRAVYGASRSEIISSHLARYFYMLARARRTLRELFSDGEAMLIVDCLNGTGFHDTFGVYLVAHEIADGIALDGLARKWSVDGPALLAKLNALTDAQNLALVDSVVSWWDRVSKGESPASTAAVIFGEVGHD